MRYVVHITPADVGRRVSLRYRTHDDPPLSDVIGWIRSWSGGAVTVQRKDGTALTVAEADLVAGKVLGPPPQR